LRKGGGAVAHTKSSKKRVRQTERRRLHNRSLKSRMRTAVKTAEKLLDQGDAASAVEAFRTAAAELDKAGRKRLIHPNAAARKKSRLERRLAGAKEAPPLR
jgi:small subunit ribosomal protein S20